MLDKELTSRIKKELGTVGIMFVISLILFKIVFYKEGITTITRTTATFYWIFIIPGFILMYQWHEKIGFLERFIIGVAVSAAVMGIGSYYLGLAGLHVRYHGIVIPIALILVSALLLVKAKDNAKNS